MDSENDLKTIGIRYMWTGIFSNPQKNADTKISGYSEWTWP